MKEIRPLLAITIIILTSTFSKAQPQFPANGELYTNEVVPRIDILIHPDTLNWIYQNVESEHEFRAVFVFDNGNVHDTIRDIGFRLRGNTSRYSQKKSFKVSFNTFISGRKYFGVEKLNLNGEHNDPSISRAKLCWDIFRKSEIASPRANHIEVYINGNYHGLYINVEHIDEEFVKTYFGNNDGNLYKCLYPADLTYRGADPDSYKFMSDGRRTYELKINEEEDDYSDLANFIDILNNTPIFSLPCELEKVFNVQDYLKIAAIDVLTANWDGYIFNKNNFYLYRNTKTGIFEYIPYDVDNTFGIDWFGIDWASRDIYSWAHSSEPRPLFTRLMQVSEYKAQYTYYLKQVIAEITGIQTFIDNMFAIREQIRPYVADDPYYPLDYGYNIQSFNTSFTAGTGAHVPVGLQPYIQNRNSIALSQAQNTNAAPMIKYITHNSPPALQQMIVSASAEDESLNSVMLEYRINNGLWEQTTMADNGQNGDIIPGDGIFTVALPGMASGTLFEFRIKATDNNQVTSTKPCDPMQYNVPVTNPMKLYINEFMASNSSTIADEFGEYDDWIEIYNGSDQAIWLGDKYLTDNLNNPVKWAFPDTSISAGGYLLVWADGQPSQGPMHTLYKLDKDKEEIGLFDNAASGYARIDNITYTNQTSNISMGRVIDGAIEWKLFDSPTPGSTNSLVGIDEKNLQDLIIWPNPVINGILYISKKTDFTIYDIAGRKLIEFGNSNQVNVQSLKSGIYIIKTKNSESFRFIVN
ncbi:MAG: CotH kinase family protein [Lentimicrobium sp.]|nr:CotH kinase family protein [Lentimicrobium sp.]